MTASKATSLALKSALYIGEDEDLKESVRVAISSKYTMESLAGAPKVWPQEVDLVLMEFDGEKAFTLSNIAHVLTLSKGVPLYILLKQKDVDFIIEASHYGVQGFIECPYEVLQILSIIHMQDRRRTGKNGVVSSFFSLKGGVGCTTLATNVAAHIRSMTDQHAVILDLNVPLGDTALYLNMEERQLYTITDFIHNINRFDDNLIYKSLSKHESGLFLLPLPVEMTELDSLNGETIKKIIASLRRYFDHVIIDCASNLSDVTLSCLDVSDNIILVAEPSLSSLRSVNKVLQLGKRLGYSEDTMTLLINRHQSNIDEGLEEIIQMLEAGQTTYVDNDYILFNESLNKGELINKYAPKSRVNQQLECIAKLLHHGAAHHEVMRDEGTQKTTQSLMGFMKQSLMTHLKKPSLINIKFKSKKTESDQPELKAVKS